jgi:nucleoside-diphosphate-sugar epimerase
MKILVLGSAGQIGKPTCKYLREMGHSVIEHDIKDSNYYDLREMGDGRLDVAMKYCDFVYYFASDVGGAKYLEANEHTHRFISDNMKIMVNVFDSLKYYNKPFIFTSSQMSELGHSSYGMLKKLGEKMTNDIGGLVVRLWNVYGPEEEEEKSHVITDFCKMAKHDGVIKMRTDGTESRQLLYARDCAECFLTLTEQYDTLDKSKNALSLLFPIPVTYRLLLSIPCFSFIVERQVYRLCI